ncbi:enoyl-CoA hydratase EchA [Cupriavidus necator N-1]|jgi:enoyl-CoA hydratase/carnithine racemase|uniref:Enoyl-CoA hydratase EchA n=1 Tax=Cupriavidus necator (strain ATCC 43291 / DSM 13513 / CCUG 52238 / LMG 8453 / N-1) TaxID=1042878 RepID=F8GSW3_CUPNN|nr:MULTISPECIES: enoyl-CoA hydratase-related protein [Cupriavidus]AEI81090.1 enoyl-CoA hydratase EchA [Cupriavidus necator N-1]KAI3600235.1 Enoyl-CoA hydratase [Cupriavidus necator H850]MDX6009289.1 enoyl-CoA hydratase-related protein [Cupriavidus necator]QUN25733.1 enoyl-CoA hydratase/isomerase family protein [Cupriavidus sp. KK10]
MRQPILIERDAQVATITLNNPDKLNAMDLSMWQGLTEAIQGLSADDTLRCVVLRGAGDKAFAAGADIAEFDTMRANAAQAQQYGEITNATMRAIAECRHPTIALIQGACVGGGLEIASMCDLRICGESSRFGVPVNRLGLVMSYGELGGLVALAGPATALEIVLEGRVFDAAEALEKRLVNRVVADEAVPDEAYATARRIAAGAPLVARWHKQFVRRLSDPTPLRPEEHAESYVCFDTEDFRIGHRAFIDKTRPQFVGR